MPPETTHDKFKSLGDLAAYHIVEGIMVPMRALFFLVGVIAGVVALPFFAFLALHQRLK